MHVTFVPARIHEKPVGQNIDCSLMASRGAQKPESKQCPIPNELLTYLTRP